MRLFISIIITLAISACSTTYPNQNITGQSFPRVIGTKLTNQAIIIPQDLQAEKTLLLIGYRQNAQFDIDRWLIGLDMHKAQVAVYEVPAIQGVVARIFRRQIDNGMRAGIPKALWSEVITVYKDGDKIQALTGNQQANNARVVLLNKNGKILYFYDQGFAVSALNEVLGLL